MEKKTWLKQEIDKRGWTGHELARRIGYSRTQAHRYVKGKQRPTITACQKIAAAFGGGMTAQEVMRRVGRFPPLPDDYDKAQEDELIEIFQELGYSDRKTLIEFAQFLLSRDEGNDENGGDGGA